MCWVQGCKDTSKTDARTSLEPQHKKCISVKYKLEDIINHSVFQTKNLSVQQKNANIAHYSNIIHADSHKVHAHFLFSISIYYCWIDFSMLKHLQQIFTSGFNKLMRSHDHNNRDERFFLRHFKLKLVLKCINQHLKSIHTRY